MLSTNNPFAAFEIWFAEAKQHKQIIDHNAMALATVNEQGAPSIRTVLLKKFSDSGLVFFTNLASQKAQELQGNKQVCLNFYWEPLGKQIRVSGVAEQLNDQEADAYFNSRARGSQLSAITSKQSQPLENYAIFEDELVANTKKFSGQELVRPEYWSGFCVIPHRFEFWLAGDFRRHQRVVFTKEADSSWSEQMLYP